MEHFRSASLGVRTKSDRSPVSESDEAVEQMIRERLACELPQDCVLGEEQGGEGSLPRRWIIDPIDATKNYIRGVPVFATLIALQKHHSIELGVVSAPALGRRWWAARGDGAWCNGRGIRVSAVMTLEDAHFAYDDYAGFERHGLSNAYLTFARRCARTRAFGDFWSHMLVAEGAMDIAVEPEVALWDMAAVQVIVEEAGGRFSTMEGESRFDGGSGVSTNGSLHDQVLTVLASERTK